MFKGFLTAQAEAPKGPIPTQNRHQKTTVNKKVHYTTLCLRSMHAAKTTGLTTKGKLKISMMNAGTDNRAW